MGLSRASLLSVVVIWGSCLAGLSATPGFPSRDRQAAREAYSEARRFVSNLRSQPEAERTAKQLDRAIYFFRRVIDFDPTYGAADDSLFEIAKLYDEKWGRFARPRDKGRAINFYEFVAREYPLTKHRSAALARASELSVARPPQRRKEAAAPNASTPRAREPARLRNIPATVERIRYWSGPSYTRIVVDLDGEADFRTGNLRNPDRIYLDLKSARLQRGIERVHAINDVFIKSVRVGQNRPEVVRVVLDFSSFGDTTVFALFNPFRIVVDVKAPRTSSGHPSSRSGGSVRTATVEIPLRGDQEPNQVTENVAVIPTLNLDGDRTLTRTLGLKVGRIVIDPGHGGHDHGTVGPGGLREKDLVLSISTKLRRLLETRLQTDVVMTRESDEFVPLEVRTALANQIGADLFVSIHANASRSRKILGVETFYLSLPSTADEREVATRENATSQRNIRELEDLLKRIAKGDYVDESRELASIVQTSLYDDLKKTRPRARNRGVKKAPFIVLIGSNMPSILTEIGFVTHPSEEKFFKTKKGQDVIAESLFQGIERYLRSLGGIRPPSAEARPTSGESQ